MSDQSKSPESAKTGSSPDELVQDLEVKLNEEQQSQVTGGRVKTSDKQQQAVLDFVKG